VGCGLPWSRDLGCGRPAHDTIAAATGAPKTTKEALHQLIDELPEEALPAIEQYLLTFRNDPVLRAAQLAPEDDEDLTPEEEAKMEMARIATCSIEGSSRALGPLLFCSIREVQPLASLAVRSEECITQWAARILSLWVKR
jgi:hypothetical protein